MDWADYTKMLVGILAIVNPIGAIPVFVAITEGQSKLELNRTARLSTTATAVIMLTSFWLGEGLLQFFGISIPSFRIGGGILILLMAISMMHARRSEVRHTKAEANEAEEKENVGIVPLAIPLLAGPGTISTIIICAHASSDWLHMLALNGGLLVIALIVWIALRLAMPIAELLGQTGINIVTRIMGILLTAIAVEFITDGLGETFPKLVSG